ncbi:MAG TPA: sigma-54 dependent transcriptional regulator, partial [Candidatus Kryptobacter bacterium]|nr:sigma-54 dependent transcriptional regulator [Candidatus Kryptobacter bacterium]
MKDRIAVIDDHADSLEILREALSPTYQVETFSDPVAAMAKIKGGGFSAVVTDVMMPGLNGVELMSRLLESSPTLPVILITAFGTLEAAANTIKTGAFDYLSKPLNLNEIRLVVSNAVSHFHVAEDAKRLGGNEVEQGIVSNVVGKSEKMLRVFKVIGRAGPTNSSILIQGESGTGKEIVARSIHLNSPRAEKPFIPINVAAIPEQLLEAELFGHEKGAFTGALFARDGLFTEAEGGTLFLDEVGEIPLQLQPKLLRVLQEHEVRRIGSSVSRIVDVRIIAATNRNLEDLVREKQFREDLFYRLSVIKIELPPLRERREDIRLLAEYFIKKYNTQHNKQVTGIAADLLTKIENLDWPGNVRELENFIDRTVALATGPVLTVSD